MVVIFFNNVIVQSYLSTTFCDRFSIIKFQDVFFLLPSTVRVIGYVFAERVLGDIYRSLCGEETKCTFFRKTNNVI